MEKKKQEVNEGFVNEQIKLWQCFAMAIAASFF